MELLDWFVQLEPRAHGGHLDAWKLKKLLSVESTMLESLEKEGSMMQAQSEAKGPGVSPC